MPLHKIKDFDPDYRSNFQEKDVIGFDLYTNGEKAGSVDDLLVDDQGKIRYLIVNTGIWIFGKKVLLPIGRAHINYDDRHVVVEGLTLQQVETLPPYDGDVSVDFEHEEQVRNVYRPTAPGNVSVDNSAPLDYDRDTYAYDRDPALYNLDDTHHQNLRLYEERLIANKTRTKTGDVVVGKHLETKTSKVSVPIDKEKIVIERTTPSNATVTPDNTAFQSGEVARFDVYEETPDIRKEAFVREEVTVRKEVERETVDASETLRREELDVDTQGQPVVEGGSDPNRSKVLNK
jgi:uncharacterized protein (TIGR02271 family)